MFLDGQRGKVFIRAAAVWAIVVAAAWLHAGCGGTSEWWDGLRADRRSDRPGALKPAGPGAVRIVRDEHRVSPAADGKEAEPASPEQLEQRIRDYVSQFPVGDDDRKIRQAQAGPAEQSPEDRPGDTLLGGAAGHQPSGTAGPAGGQRPDGPGEIPQETSPSSPSGPAAGGQSPEGSGDQRRAAPALPVVRSVSVEDGVQQPPVSPDAPDGDRSQVNLPLKIEPEPPQGRTIEAAIAELERRIAAEPNDLSSQLRLRMLFLAEGQDAKAMAPVSGVSRDMAEMVQGLVRIVASSRDAVVDPAGKADEVLEAVDAFRERIQAHAELQVPRVILCTEAISFGAFKSFPPENLVAGRTTPVVLYCEVKNFSSELTPERQYKTLLTWQVELLDDQGRPVTTLSEKPFEDLSRNRRQDFFLADIIHLPGELKPGEYTVRIQIEDRVSRRFSSGTTTFTLKAPGT